uniref:Biotin carboxyl carrier protein of acetyl-CoA carboxylase n=1 Tax=Pleurostichidium falkenbergii TaxID=121064 RepID=A0A4D6UXH8_9FLOR|nr:acetyl-CoA carboxylase, biotin carboxyl carrier protein [Pleurostichidium falkenbergii]QCH39685.1 acetyl-CoA carboxylase, biotin carboxyl carrier protein [Pleurostichidium falkenbergii]
MLNIKNVTKLISYIHKNDMNQLKIEKKDTRITINRIKTNKQACSYFLTHNNDYKENIKVVSENIDLGQNLKKENRIEHSNLYSTIISPMVGTFYKSPGPSESSFIEVGDTVKPKQIVCIIEAMKLMNEIESDLKGEVVEILVKDGDIVDCGQALVKIKVI